MAEIKNVKDWTLDDLQQALDDNYDDANDLQAADDAKDTGTSR